MVFAKGKKKNVLVLLCIVCLILISCQESVSTKQLVAIEVKAHPTKVNYYEGEAFSSSGLRILGIYSDNTTQEITDFGISIAEGVTLTRAGTQSVIVSYGGKTCSFSISVLEVRIVSIAIKHMPEKTSYYLGDKFASYGLEIVAQYSNGSEKAITNYNLSIEDNAILDSLGTKTVTASYLNESVSFKIKTEMPELDRISIKSLPSKLVYRKGDSFESSGLSVYAIYKNGYKVEISDYSISLSNNTILSSDGSKAISIHYDGKETSFNIEVTEAELTDISIASLPLKLVYTKGEVFDSSGIEVNGIYSDSTQKKLDCFDLSIANGTILTQEGSVIINIHYSGKVASFNIAVNKPSLIALSVKTLPKKTDYVEGDLLDLTGLVVVGKYSDNSTVVVNDFYTDPASNSVMSSTGTREISIIQGECTTSFNVYVREDTSVRYSRRYQSMGLARTVNLITASNLMPTSGNKSIFDPEKLGRCEVIEQVIRTQPETVISGSSFSEFSTKLKTYFENKTSTNLDAYVMSCSADFGVSFDLNFDFDYRSKEYYLKLSKSITSYEIAINGYRDMDLISSMLSQDFRDDALKVQNGTMKPEEFIRLYGTHVILAAYIGGSVDVVYYCVSNEETSNTEFAFGMQEFISADTLFGNGSVGNGTTLSIETKLSTKNENGSCQIRVNPVGGATIGFGDSIEDIRNGFKTWSSSLNDDNMTVVDVPNGSLYCVWEYLDDSYATAKRILNNYFFNECERVESDFASKITEAKSASTVFFDETTNTLVFNFTSMRTKNELDSFSYSGFNSTGNYDLVIPPSFNGNRIDRVKIKGCYKNEDEDGRPIDIVLPLSVVLDSAWNRNVTLVMENIAFKAYDAVPALDLSNCPSGMELTIETVGAVRLEGGASSAGIEGPKQNITLINPDDNNKIIIIGGNGFDGRTDTNGDDGKPAICCNTVTLSGQIEMIGGNGGNGGNGADGKAGVDADANDVRTDGERGHNGGKGGDGAYALITNNITLDNCSLVVKTGNGGNGGDGGNGGRGGNNGWWLGWVKGSSGGNGGNGGDGGNSIPLQLTGLIVSSINSTYSSYCNEVGNGGKAGKGGPKGSTCGFGVTNDPHDGYAGNPGKNGVNTTN